MVMGIGSAWATDVTFNYADYKGKGTSSSGSEYTMVKTDVSITNTKFYGNNSYAHFYANGTTTITPASGVTITEIKITASATNYNGFQSSGTITASTGSVSGNTSSTTVTWTGSANEAFTITNNKQIRWTSIVVTYTTSGGGDTPITYTVTYDGNGSTSGDVPTDDNEYESGNTVTVLGNTGNLAIEHHTFTGWNTVATGTGTSYVAGNTFNITANTTLYAQWAINTHTVTLPETDLFGTYTMSATNPVPYGTEVTLTYTPATGYEKYIATWSVNGEEIAKDKFTMPDEAVTVTVSLKEKTTSDMIIDFESEATAYSDWSFTNIVSNYKNSGVDTHSGAKYGSTDGKASGSIQTEEKVTPVSLTCYLSKQTTNTTASTWYVQVSSDGTTWTEAGSTSATDMSKGEWKEFTVDLSTYSDVYVRVYYSGSTAVRLIDDLTLTVNGTAKPSISASDVNLTYDATSGSITYTIHNEVEGGTLSASNEADWLTLGTVGDNIPFTCLANTEPIGRTATVTLTYTYGDNETVIKDVTVTQAGVPVISSYSTIPDLFAAATSTETDVNVTFDSWVVSGVSTNGKNVFVTDNNGNGFVIYSSSDMSNTYSAGSILSGTVSCKLKLFNGFAELLEVDANDLTITSGGAVTAANITMANLAGVNTGALVSYTGLTCSVDNNKYYLSDGITTLQVYNSLYAFEALEDGKIYNITGIFQQYNNTKEVLPRSEADIEEVEVQHEQYTLTVSNLNHVNTFVFDASEQNEMLLEGAGSISVYDGTSVLISVDVEQGYVLESLMVDGEDVTSQIDETGAYTFTMPTHDVTVTATAVEAPTPQPATTYTLATAIVPGKHYIIVGKKDGTYKAMGKQTSNNRSAVEITVDEGTASVAADAGIHDFVIYGPDANGYYTIYDAKEDSKGYLYAAQGTGTGNYLRTEEKPDILGNGIWSIGINAEGVATIKATNEGIDRNWMRYNSGNSLFSCYSSGQQDIYLYEKDGEEAPTETVTITAAKYATFCSELAVDFSQTGATVYKAKADEATKKVIFSAISDGIVPAYTGVILYMENAGELTVPGSLTKGEGDWNDNELVATIERTLVKKTTTIGDVTKYNYILQSGESGIVFNRATVDGAYMPAGKAYLSTTVDAVESRMMVSIEGDTTGINTVNGEGLKVNGYYNLNGQRVDNPQKGLYIVNGKKVMVK